MQNNGAMKIVYFTHAQTAETRRSFHPSVNTGFEARRLVEFTGINCQTSHVTKCRLQGSGSWCTEFLLCVEVLCSLDYLNVLYMGVCIYCNL